MIYLTILQVEVVFQEKNQLIYIGYQYFIASQIIYF